MPTLAPTYRVKKGDTLYSIANAHGTTVNKLANSTESAPRAALIRERC